MAQESIYKYINRMAGENPQLPYVFQEQGAGWQDVSFVLWDDEIPFSLKDKMTLELMEEIVICVKRQRLTRKFRQILREKPLYLYLVKLNMRLGLYLTEKIIKEKQLYSWGMKLATQSAIAEEVKLGMLILGYFENDLVRQIVKTLGLHSEFTLYAVEASKNFHNQNEFLFELVQNTVGFGKFVALTLFEPVKPEQKKWLFAQGAQNRMLPNLSALVCLEKVEMASFYRKLTLTGRKFSQLAYLLAYTAEQQNLKEAKQGLFLAQKYLEAFPTYAKSFLDLAAVVMLAENIDYIDEQEEENGENQNEWTGVLKDELREQCREILKQPKWRNLALYEFNRTSAETSLIIAVLENLKLAPPFENFLPLLQRDLFDFDLLRFFLVKYPQEYWYDVLRYLAHVLPDEVFDEGPQKGGAGNAENEFKPDIWVVFMLKAFCKIKVYREDLILSCLTARFPDVRKAAIQALGIFKTKWSVAVRPVLEETYKNEPLKIIKNRLWRLMGKKNKGKGKEQRYLDITGVQITPSPFDRSILKTRIAGTYYRDLLVVEDLVGAGDLLYLVREPGNEHDPRAIMVTTEDGYVLGYIPKMANKIPSSLLDKGEKIYAILLSDNLQEKKTEIEIMLNKKPERLGNIIQLPFWNDKVHYV